MTRLNVVLFAAVLATMLSVVRTQYESRRLFVDMEKATIEMRRLEIDNATLQVDKRAQATPLRIEKLAQERLHMRSASPAVTQYLRYDKDAVATESAK
ncbi:MAG: cell division protein FtsL [Burkholderiaceae bacterium]|nr:cell division protein FtsL [Burkholderiaceae bacterium]